MLSKEKILEAAENSMAELVATKITEQVTANLAEKWNLMLSELAHSRRTTEQAKTALAEAQAQNARMMQLLDMKEEECQRSRELQAQASEILSEALRMLGAGE